ncbi:MAG: AbrB/MazE/SpoVT family DNA-binding domain-containing protein [Candidatus Zixiibacteriota bacterium]
MPLVKITRSRQVTIPKELFEGLDLQQGDYIEVTREGDQLILRPKTVVDRQRAQAKDRLFKLLEQIWERNKDVDPEVVEREVAQALQEVRQARRTHKPTNMNQ